MGINFFGRQPLGKHSKSRRGRLESDGMLSYKMCLKKIGSEHVDLNQVPECCVFWLTVTLPLLSLCIGLNRFTHWHVFDK